jgi:hypothetical protein
MTSTVTDYAAAAAALPDEYFLGQVVSFTICEQDIELDAARALLATHNLRTDTMRKRLRPIDAFKKAANEIAVKFDRDVQGEQHSLLVRPVGQDSAESHRHIVFERAIFKTGQRRRVEHETIWKLMYDRGKRLKDGTIQDDSIYVEQQTTIGGVSLTAEEQAWVDEHIGANGDKLRERFDHWRTHLDSHAMRTFVREYVVDLLGGISIKGNSGGQYFVQQKHAAELRDLMAFVKEIGSKMHTIPLLDIVEQREMLAEAFIEETMDVIRAEMAELNKILANPTRTITEATYDEKVAKAVTLIAKHGEYSTLLDKNLDRADTELQIYKTQALSLFSRVKQPKSLGSGGK